MTTAQDFVREEMSGRRKRRGPIWNGLALTSLFVAAGFVVTSMTLSPVPTPSNVVKGYVEAGFDRDWRTMWTQLCQQARDGHGTYAAYVTTKRDAFGFLPRSVEVSTGRPHRVAGEPSAVTVPLSVESQDEAYMGWGTDGAVTLIREDDEWRVCPRELLHR